MHYVPCFSFLFSFSHLAPPLLFSSPSSSSPFYLPLLPLLLLSFLQVVEKRLEEEEEG